MPDWLLREKTKATISNSSKRRRSNSTSSTLKKMIKGTDDGDGDGDKEDNYDFDDSLIFDKDETELTGDKESEEEDAPQET